MTEVHISVFPHTKAPRNSSQIAPEAPTLRGRFEVGVLGAFAVLKAPAKRSVMVLGVILFQRWRQAYAWRSRKMRELPKIVRSTACLFPRQPTGPGYLPRILAQDTGPGYESFRTPRQDHAGEMEARKCEARSFSRQMTALGARYSYCHIDYTSSSRRNRLCTPAALSGRGVSSRRERGRLTLGPALMRRGRCAGAGASGSLERRSRCAATERRRMVRCFEEGIRSAPVLRRLLQLPALDLRPIRSRRCRARC